MRFGNLLKDKRCVVSFAIWVVIFIICNSIYNMSFSLAKEIIGNSNSSLGLVLNLLVRYNSPCAFLSSVLTMMLFPIYLISKGQTTRLVFSFIILPLATIAVTLLFSGMILYATIVHAIPIIFDSAMLHAYDVIAFLVLSIAAMIVAMAVGKW